MYFLHFIHPYMNSLAGYDLKNPARSHLFFVVIFRVVGKDIKWNIKNRLKTGQNQFFYLKFFLSVVRYIVDLTRQYFHVRLWKDIRYWEVSAINCFFWWDFAFIAFLFSEKLSFLNSCSLCKGFTIKLECTRVGLLVSPFKKRK